MASDTLLIYGATGFTGRLVAEEARRVATRYDRCPKVLLSAVDLAATVIFWL